MFAAVHESGLCAGIRPLDGEIARLRDLAVGELRSRWHNVFRRRPHPHLPRHLLFRVLAYRLQADVLGDLDGESQHLLDRSVSPEDAGKRAVALVRRTADLRPGTKPGELISKQELMDRVWPSIVVEPANLTVHMSALRRTLRDGRDGNRFIINVPGRGYSFVASVERGRTGSTSL
jgi:DNA-binding response OmpR family regulator